MQHNEEVDDLLPAQVSGKRSNEAHVCGGLEAVGDSR